MKRHHIVGIFAGICAIGLAVSNLLSGNIVDGLTSFIVLSILAVATFFKDKLPTKWSHVIIPIEICVVIIFLLLFEGILEFIH